jgi:two-component system, OmpR family, KDP operon response regulator KdpE
LKVSDRILVIDDEVQIRRFLGISLRAQGYDVAEAGTGLEGLEILATRGADLVILDLGLPDRDGQDVLRELRTWSAVPVIVLSVRSNEAEKVALLDAGANDYVTKPFGVQELSARLRGLLKRKPGSDQVAVFDDGHVRIDTARRLVTRDGEPVTLSRKEWTLLALLLKHSGRLLTQPQLLRELWGPTHQEDTHYLRILVAKLRTKLGDDASAPRYIRTEAGVGLRFIGGEP